MTVSPAGALSTTCKKSHTSPTMVPDGPASSGREIGEELRDVVGIHLAQLVAHCHLDVEDDLATIIPVSDDDPPDGDHWWHRRRS